MRMKGNNSNVTFISAYPLTMAYSDKTKEESYEQLHHAIQSVPHNHNLFLLSDFNARVGSDHTTWYKVLDHHGIRKENSNGTILLTLCTGRQLVITNALFTQRIALRRLGDTHALVIGIKLILSSSDKKPDHALLKSKVAISLQLKRQHRRVQQTKKLDVAKLANSETQDTLRDNVASALEDFVDRH